MPRWVRGSVGAAEGGRPLRTRHAAGLIGLAIATVPAGVASAGTLSVEPRPLPGYAPPPDAAVYAARAGEQNDLLVSGFFGGGGVRARVRVSDAGAVVDARSPCHSLDSHSAQCELADYPYVTFAWVSAGDGNDRVRTEGHGTGYIYGGGGRDELFSSDDYVLLDGDIEEETGDLGVGPDLFVGGHVSYGLRKAPVRVDLADQLPDGAAGESDTLRAVPGVTGGYGDDVLAGATYEGTPETYGRVEGGPGADRLTSRGGSLYGGPGADVLRGNAGRDFQEGGPGPDRMFGGSGDDELYGGFRDGGGDRIFAGQGDDLIVAVGNDLVSCGGGASDTVGVYADYAEPGHGGLLSRGCEELEFAGEYDTQLTVKPYPTAIWRGTAIFEFEDGCGRGRLTLHRTQDRVLLGRGGFRRTRLVPVKLTPAGRDLVQRSHAGPVTVRARCGPDHLFEWRIRLGRRR